MAPATEIRPDTEFTSLFREHFAYVWRSLLRLGAGTHEAEDLVQEVFVVVHRRLHTFDRARSIRPWLFGVAFNVLRDHRRRVSTRTERASTPFEEDRGSRSDPSIRALEAADLVRLALRAIPEERLAVFVLYELDQVPMDEIARVLQIPVDTGYSRLRKARQEFRAAVDASGGA